MALPVESSLSKPRRANKVSFQKCYDCGRVPKVLKNRQVHGTVHIQITEIMFKMYKTQLWYSTCFRTLENEPEDLLA